MSDQTIVCPHCNEVIPLNEALSHQIKEQLQEEFRKENEKKHEEIMKKYQEIEAQKKKLEEEKIDLEKTVQEKLELGKHKMWAVAQKKAEEKMSLELKDLKDQSEEKTKKLEEAEKNELELRKKTRELEEQKKNLDLTMQRKLDEERNKISEQAKKDVFEENRMKFLEKDKQMEMMKKQIDELKQKSEQGSTQIQGEVQEEDLKQILESNFPVDTIDDVPPGIRGADLIQTVNSRFGERCGVILWESKNTKHFCNDWIKKLKDDQAISKADVCILVSKTLPEDFNGFKRIDGVWVVDYKFIIPFTQTLRVHLLEMHKTKQSLIGRDQKMEYLYSYLSGSQFKNRIENIVMAFTGMKSELDKEKRAMERIWSRREKEIERVVLNTSGLYGDLQGIVGASLPEVKNLSLDTGDEDQEKIDENEKVQELL